MNENLKDWLFFTIFLFLIGWFVVCFVTMDFVWPLSTGPSRLWLVISAFLGTGYMVDMDDKRSKKQ